MHIKSLILLVTSSHLHVFVCDLGVAKLQNKIATIKSSRGTGAGTIAYKALEVFMVSKRSTPVNINSFGCKIFGTRVMSPSHHFVQTLKAAEEHRKFCVSSKALDP